MNKIGSDMPEVVSSQTNSQENITSNDTILLDGSEDIEKLESVTDKAIKMTDNNTIDNSKKNTILNESNKKDVINSTDKNSQILQNSINVDEEAKKDLDLKATGGKVESKISMEESPKSGLQGKDDSSTNVDKRLTNQELEVTCQDAAKKSNIMETIHIDLKRVSQKENGTSERCVGAVVDLGDDTDDDAPTLKQNTVSKSIPTSELVRKSTNCSSDTAVVIGSDSENEDMSDKKRDNMKKTEVLDDDDDDCVVIEDSTSVCNDLNKRKCTSIEESSNDDAQPPTKRIRSSISGNIESNVIRQENSLLKKTSDNSIYPVTITPAPNASAQGPPKLVPVSNIPNTIGVGLSTVPQGNNSSLLPGLTDDMFVLEAPSFIVPYIYEKPPVITLTAIVKEIETLYNLSKEDLAEADKSDEFDMITEQNKSEKVDTETKKKKKRWGGDDGDESWSEQSEEEEDDDDDSESGVRTKVLIKEASDDLAVLKGAIKPVSAVVQISGTNASGPVSKPGQENYFESPLGKFFMDIGVGLVQEFVQSDLIRLQKRKMRKSLGKNTMEFERAIAALSGNLEASKKKNAAFKFTMKRCEFCNFKSESALAMANHYETPHMNGALYKCNFCNFEIRNATEIVYHMEAVHNIKARLIKPLPYHQCPNCGFEDNGKAKLARHQPVCAKKFRPELNLAPPNDWEAPAKIPRIKPRHGLVGTATAYQAMAAQAAAQKAALASIQQQQQAAARTLQAATLAAQSAANKIRGRSPVVQRQMPNTTGMIRPPGTIRTPMNSNIVISNNYQLPNNQLLQASNAMNKKPLSGQPSISITPLPRQSNAPSTPSLPSTSKVPPAGVKPGQNPAGKKAQFVICEICDGYIQDLEQLRNHMQWMHKVKIHPKMIYNRPPLNCQKCQFRFFTDQGLERHLLGSHGLVTSSMQEAANKGKDSGRCPVCGRMYQWKLLNHVSRDHHMTLKPAHLSYKCTVCTATFGMYKQFETHVYTAHSTVAKRAMDGKKTNAPGPSSSNSGGQRATSTNDSILKPLKINDEITIIPQPATKPRITNMESHVID